jgi:E3 ubiquitin-protein ligase EDD1
MGEALPLADQPQLLTPAARREDLFGIPRQQVNGTVPAADLYIPVYRLSGLPLLLD